MEKKKFSYAYNLFDKNLSIFETYLQLQTKQQQKQIMNDENYLSSLFVVFLNFQDILVLFCCLMDSH